MSTLRQTRQAMMTLLLRKGASPAGLCLLTVPGRKTGIPRTTPVAPVQDREGRWLVAGFGPGGPAPSVRAAGRVTLSRGRTTEAVPALARLRPAPRPGAPGAATSGAAQRRHRE